MDPHTLQRLGRERQHLLLDEAVRIRQARRLEPQRPSPLRTRLAHWLRLWAQHLDHQPDALPREQQC